MTQSEHCRLGVLFNLDVFQVYDRLECNRPKHRSVSPTRNRPVSFLQDRAARMNFMAPQARCASPGLGRVTRGARGVLGVCLP